MNRPRLSPEDYKILVREIGKPEKRFGKAAAQGGMRRYLNHVKETTKRTEAISKLRSELAELEAKTG
jgi:hypothetical protein